MLSLNLMRLRSRARQSWHWSSITYWFRIPLTCDKRLCRPAITLLGDAAMPLTHEAGGSRARSIIIGAGEFADLELGPKALKWIQKHGITRSMLEEVFHLTSGDVAITASAVPGASKREMTISCYLLCGVRGLLKNDVPSLDEGEAVAVCKRLTAYDRNNHTTNRLAVGNRMSGAKPTFTLTGPGETAAADLLKRMAPG